MIIGDISERNLLDCSRSITLQSVSPSSSFRNYFRNPPNKKKPPRWCKPNNIYLKVLKLNALSITPFAPSQNFRLGTSRPLSPSFSPPPFSQNARKLELAASLIGWELSGVHCTDGKMSRTHSNNKKKGLGWMDGNRKGSGNPFSIRFMRLLYTSTLNCCLSIYLSLCLPNRPATPAMPLLPLSCIFMRLIFGTRISLCASMHWTEAIRIY